MKKIIGLIVLCFLVGCEEILFEEDISTLNVDLLAPTNDVSVNAGAITFSWQGVNGAANYELQVATPTFSDATQIVLDTVIAGVSFAQQLEANNYEWRVKALNSAHETKYTTNAFEAVEVQEP